MIFKIAAKSTQIKEFREADEILQLVDRGNNYGKNKSKDVKMSRKNSYGLATSVSGDMNKNNGVANTLNMKLQVMSQEQSFQDHMEREFESLVKSIKEIKRKSVIAFGGACTLLPEEVINSVV